ncbi:hypothetical protein M011DRAFT_51772 [Sporormia fimetaria CBS 119925]|uniref:Uncharacterized protein n=1 Tax=Sporormia fimetaria CBS 119925 TaxID=1340428 RepID=A0A6A6V9B8_9PLEO|nr:hypothetical protein M011DRAFT_51772 [Sporormia fimetaria CBS 119925]
MTDCNVNDSLPAPASMESTTRSPNSATSGPLSTRMCSGTMEREAVPPAFPHYTASGAGIFQVNCAAPAMICVRSLWNAYSDRRGSLHHVSISAPKRLGVLRSVSRCPLHRERVTTVDAAPLLGPPCSHDGLTDSRQKMSGPQGRAAVLRPVACRGHRG